MIPRGNSQSLVPATTLTGMYRTSSPAPLVGRDALDAFSRPELNVVRGNDEAGRLKLRLERVRPRDGGSSKCRQTSPVD